jgi:hypothetical protein
MVTCRSVPLVTWEAVTAMEGAPVESYYDTHWQKGLWSTQAKVESIVLKAAWYRGRDSSVVNDPHGKPDCTPLLVGHPSALGSLDGDLMFSLHVVGELLNWGLREMNE